MYIYTAISWDAMSFVITRYTKLINMILCVHVYIYIYKKRYKQKKRKIKTKR